MGCTERSLEHNIESTQAQPTTAHGGVPQPNGEGVASKVGCWDAWIAGGKPESEPKTATSLTHSHTQTHTRLR